MIRHRMDRAQQDPIRMYANLSVVIRYGWSSFPDRPKMKSITSSSLVLDEEGDVVDLGEIVVMGSPVVGSIVGTAELTWAEPSAEFPDSLSSSFRWLLFTMTPGSWSWV